MAKANQKKHFLLGVKFTVKHAFVRKTDRKLSNRTKCIFFYLFLVGLGGGCGATDKNLEDFIKLGGVSK